jgi:hypothetical protein
MAYHDSQATYLDKGPSGRMQIYNPFLKAPYATYMEMYAGELYAARLCHT